MREVALHRARRDEEPGGDVLVRQPFGDQTHDIVLGRRQRAPPSGRPLTVTMAPAGVRNRLKGRQGRALGPSAVEVAVAERITNGVDRGCVAVVVDLEPDRAGYSPSGIGRAVERNAVNLGIVAAQCCLSFKSVVAVRVRLMKLV